MTSGFTQWLNNNSTPNNQIFNTNISQTPFKHQQPSSTPNIYGPMRQASWNRGASFSRDLIYQIPQNSSSQFKYFQEGGDFNRMGLRDISPRGNYIYPEDANLNSIAGMMGHGAVGHYGGVSVGGGGGGGVGAVLANNRHSQSAANTPTYTFDPNSEYIDNETPSLGMMFGVKNCDRILNFDRELKYISDDEPTQETPEKKAQNSNNIISNTVFQLNTHNTHQTSSQNLHINHHHHSNQQSHHTTVSHSHTSHLPNISQPLLSNMTTIPNNHQHYSYKAETPETKKSLSSSQIISLKRPTISQKLPGRPRKDLKESIGKGSSSGKRERDDCESSIKSGDPKDSDETPARSSRGEWEYY